MKRPTTPSPHLLPPECREYLLALGGQQHAGPQQHALHQHAAQCRACGAHAAFRVRLAAGLRAAPPLPPELRSPRLLEAIHERIVDAAEDAPLGQLLAREQSAPAVLPPDAAWPQPLLGEALGAAVRAVPPLPTPLAWNAVRRSILAGLAPRRLLGSRAALWVGIAGLAAAALVSILLVTGGPGRDVTIVFTDLETAPGNEFAVLRYGALR